MPENIDLINVIKQIEDSLITYLGLDTYEKSLYYFLFRHTRLIDKENVLFVISKAPETLGMTEFSARDKIRKMNKKGCVNILETTRNGLIVKLLLPSEIEGCINTKKVSTQKINIEEIDFYNNKDFRTKILEREAFRCFYCNRKISSDSFVLDHETPQSNFGDNSYRNIVATCHECNSKKSGIDGNDFSRKLYRDNFLSSAEFDVLINKIEHLRSGKLKPEV